MSAESGSLYTLLAVSKSIKVSVILGFHYFNMGVSIMFTTYVKHETSKNNLNITTV